MKYKAILLLLVSSTLLLSAQQKPSQQWLDRKFSMFIHFGLYSVYGGVYEGKPVRRGYSEQIQSFAGIFSDWYGNTAKQFNPEQWDPDA
ncbi:MAG: alpha-L-fucosidase, partial [Bacteroidia bacterium]|nr:alpha-L-fucosidase [Bacteroidia bacterium]